MEDNLLSVAVGAQHAVVEAPALDVILRFDKGSHLAVAAEFLSEGAVFLEKLEVVLQEPEIKHPFLHSPPAFGQYPLVREQTPNNTRVVQSPFLGPFPQLLRGLGYLGVLVLNENH
jgi:hypothetical protein